MKSMLVLLEQYYIEDYYKCYSFTGVFSTIDAAKARATEIVEAIDNWSMQEGPKGYVKFDLYYVEADTNHKVLLESFEVYSTTYSDVDEYSDPDDGEMDVALEL